jgi:hypothetical protein
MSVQVLEELEVFTPLGIRFWDPVLDRAIVDGLQVRAWPWRGAGRPTPAARTRSNVYTFRWLPGMRPVEHAYPDPGFFGASPPQRRAFVVSAEDGAGRFLPVAFRVALPLPYRGVFLAGAENGSPPAARPGVALFSAPTRPTGERLTAVRGTLVDADSGAPAAWALVRVDAPHGRVFRGIADAQGRFAVTFPYPSLEEGFAGSPGSFGNGTPLGERGWDIDVSVYYEPGRLTPLPGTPIPEYRSILDQRQGSLWSLPASPSDVPQSALALRLPFGRELILRTAGLHVQLVSTALASP